MYQNYFTVSLWTRPLTEPPALERLQRVRFLPNPCSFFINEVLFSMSTVDVLFHLRKEEYFRRAEEAEPEPGAVASKDAMAELCRHVLNQRKWVHKDMKLLYTAELMHGPCSTSQLLPNLSSAGRPRWRCQPGRDAPGTAPLRTASAGRAPPAEQAETFRQGE